VVKLTGQPGQPSVITPSSSVASNPAFGIRNTEDGINLELLAGHCGLPQRVLNSAHEELIGVHGSLESFFGF
jgi:hypothetical protein